MKAIATNSKAGRDYLIVDSLEAGIVLKGSEIKSIREGNVNIRDSYARIENGEVFLFNAHISHYQQASYQNVEPERVRKLLLHRRQINKLLGQVSQRGLTLIPLKLYFKDGLVKVELALGKGKQLYDKRQDIKRRESDLQMRRAMKQNKKFR